MGKDEMSPWVAPRGSFSHKEPSKKDTILKYLFLNWNRLAPGISIGNANLLSLPTNYYTPLNMSSSGHQETWEDEIEDSSLIKVFGLCWSVGNLGMFTTLTPLL